MSEYALVTGAARNIGAAISKRLTADGFKVIAVDRADPEHSDFEEFVQLDLSQPQLVSEVIGDLANRRQITRLVNNAGIVLPATIEDTDPASLDPVTAVNLVAPLICLQKLLPAMKSAKTGRVISISSRAALGKEKRTAYSASKSGLHGMTKTWALELGRHGITVNAVGPGPIRTSLFEETNPPDDPRTAAIIEGVPVKRLGTPDDVADAVSFFASERAGFVTGQVLFVCGGMTVGSA